MEENDFKNQEAQTIEENVDLEAQLKEQVNKPSNKKLTIFNFILVFIIFVGLFIYMISVDGIDNIRAVLHQVDYKWVFLGIILLLIHWFCEAMTLHIPMKKMYPNNSLSTSIKVSMIGQLFNNITPCLTQGN